MRLIDADTLNDYVMDIWGGGNIDNTAIWYGDVFTAIHDAPTIDAVPVVRCKDCKYFLPYLTGCKTPVEKADGNCGLFVLGDVQFVARQINDFCSYGERKEG